MKQILIFSGTTEGNALAEMLSSYPVKGYISVATDYGRTCAGTYSNMEVLTGRKNKEEIAAFIRDRQISLVIDATHPFAQIVTENVKMACEMCSVTYLRCLRDPISSERDSISRERNSVSGEWDSISGEQDSAGSTWNMDREKTSTDYSEIAEKDSLVQVVEADSVREAVSFLKTTTGNILITTGSKELKAYTEIPDYQSRCYARVLSTAQAVSESCALGFEGKHLIAMQGPFSREMNVALLHHTAASYFVTKESGKAGGFPEKLEAAAEAGAVLVVIGRPKETGMTLEEVQAYLKEYITASSSPT